ncbi:MAG TPA: hypothetical protein VED16_04180 [Candidatus Acidoferrum sp.]|nr:hypothetical protein [Candidatus Acidoferrum sp.]
MHMRHSDLPPKRRRHGGDAMTTSICISSVGRVELITVANSGDIPICLNTIQERETAISRRS